LRPQGEPTEIALQVRSRALDEIIVRHDRQPMTRAVGGLLDRAIAAREIRDDITPEDLLRALVGMCYMHDQPGWQTSVLRLVDVFIDGLRIRPDRPRSKTKQRKSQ
jgi:transcriptional regulator SbtR-like protein